MKSLRAVCKTVGNKDVDPFIPVLIESIAKPSEVPECVHKLSATTFVQVRNILSALQPAPQALLAVASEPLCPKTRVVPLLWCGHNPCC